MSHYPYHTFPNQNCVEDLKLWIEEGVIYEDYFLHLVSCDVKGMCRSLDNKNWAMLKGIYTWFWHHAPSECWGSAAAVSNWKIAHGERREQK